MLYKSVNSVDAWWMSSATKISIFLAGVVMVCGSCGHQQLPTDDLLIANFKQNRTVFDRLIMMSDTDSLVVRIANDFTGLRDNSQWPRPISELGFSVQRWNDYRRLFAELNIKKGLVRADSVVYLTADGVGLVTGGEAKGYLYDPGPMHVSVPLLDTISRSSAAKGPVLRKLDEHWYIFYEVD